MRGTVDIRTLEGSRRSARRLNRLMRNYLSRETPHQPISPLITRLCLIAVFAFFSVLLLQLHKIGIDWAPIWVGGAISWTEPALAYDVDLVTSRQSAIVDTMSERPFVYPPSALLLFAPLSALSFTTSFLLFMASSMAMLAWAARPLQANPVLLLTAPPVMLALMAGQPTILIAALIVIALVQLDRDERWAGVIIAVAGMIKPQLLLLAPIALAAGGYWRAFATAGVAAAVIGAVSLAVFGLNVWSAWFSALPVFEALVTEFEPLLRNGVTPRAMAIRMDFFPNIATLCAVVFALPMVWIGFERTSNVGLRLVVLAGGALLISPYAMNYELAVFAPLFAAWRLKRLRDTILPVIWAISLFFTASLIGLLVVCIWAAIQILSQPEQEDRSTVTRKPRIRGQDNPFARGATGKTRAELPFE